MITQQQNLTMDSTANTPSSFGILRLLTCGSVDDGKSTLIGRLLLETGAVYEDHLHSLQLESKRHGTTQLQLDPALLVDGLEDERAQGITIDIAYRYLRSPRRKIIIADSPGHEQYTRNMVTAASRADVALILVDARKGILPQTKRHAIISSLLGINRFILAVNKMDLIENKQAEFERLSDEFSNFACTLGDITIQAIPLSGLCGDNVCRRSSEMAWYGGTTLLEALEAAPDEQGSQDDNFRFPIQRVVRPDSDFRGVSGTIVSGRTQVGDSIVVLPQGQRSKVRSIVTMDGELESASAGQAVTITLEDEIDLSRGDWIVSDEDAFQVSQELEARLVWMSQDSLQPGKTFFLRCSTKTTTAEVTAVQSVMEIETGSITPGNSLSLNEIGACHIVLHEPIVHDLFAESRDTGAFILIDKVSHQTVAAGIIQRGASSNDTQQGGPHRSPTLLHRKDRLQHAAASVLVYGEDTAQSAAITLQLESQLFDAAIHVILVDDQLINGVARDTLSVPSSESHTRQARKLQVARLLNDIGIATIVAIDVPKLQVNEEPSRMLPLSRSLILEVVSPEDADYESSATGRNKGLSVFQPSDNELDPALRVVTCESRINDAVNEIVTAVKARVRD